MAVNRVKLRHSLRTKIVLVSILVEVTMLALLLANSLRLLDRNLEENAQARLEAATPLLDAALSARLLERDYTQSQLTEAGNFLNQNYIGCSFSQIRDRLRNELQQLHQDMSALMTAVTAMTKANWRYI